MLDPQFDCKMMKYEKTQKENKMENLPISILSKKQVIKKSKIIRKYRLDLRIGYGDSCKNGHNTFTIMGTLKKESRQLSVKWAPEEIVKFFPELKHLIKWHLMGPNGPWHYIANTTYHAGTKDCFGKVGKEPDLEAARNSAIWPDGTLEQLQDEKALLERLPQLISEFKKDMEALGFVY